MNILFLFIKVIVIKIEKFIFSKIYFLANITIVVSKIFLLYKKNLGIHF